jgi:putative transposase
MTLHPHMPASTEALFRFTVVSQVLALEKGGEKRADAVKAVAHHLHMKLDGQTRTNGKRTVYRWLAAYEADGTAGLEPATRPHTESSDVLTERFLEFFREQKEADPRASIPELIRRAVATGILKSEDDVCRQTVWRAAHRLNVETKRRKKKKDRDARRFRYPHRMQMMLCDGKHFRAGAERLRRVALFFLDDATRYGLHVVVGTSENSALFLRGLYEVVRQYGWMDITFLDNGPGFKNDDTTEVVKNVHSLLILGTVAYPEGHGAIERFNQTAEAAILRHFDKRPDVDPDCGALELRLQHYLREVYNRAPHEGLDGLTPEARWEKDGRPLRHFSTDAELRNQFVITETRRVSSDNVVSLDSVDYEVPRGHASTRIVTLRRILDGTFATLHDGCLVDLKPVDLEENAVSRRGRRGTADAAETVAPLPPSAAELVWRRDFSPVVGPDGGFPDVPSIDKDKE